MYRHTHVIKTMLDTLHRNIPDDFSKFSNEVYYKERALYFEVFIQAVDDILHDRNIDGIQLWLIGDAEHLIDLYDICVALHWPIRYCRTMLLELIEVIRGARNSLPPTSGEIADSSSGCNTATHTLEVPLAGNWLRATTGGSHTTQAGTHLENSANTVPCDNRSEGFSERD